MLAFNITLLPLHYRIVYHHGQGARFQEQGDEDDFETKRLFNDIQSMLRFLGSGTMPNLIMYMKNIHTNAEGMYHDNTV